MKFIIKHDIRGRLRINMVQSRMSYEEADTLLYYIENLSGVTSAKVFERTCDAPFLIKETVKHCCRRCVFSSIRQRMFRLISLRIPEEN